MSTFSNVPWSLFRAAVRGIRRLYRREGRPAGARLIADAPTDTVRRTLGEEHFHPNWEFSYHYVGEDINLARPVYARDVAHADVEWWQVHVRGWDTGDNRTALWAHYEPEPTEHPGPHLDGSALSGQPARAEVVDVLHSAGIQVHRADDPSRADT